jgi:predicted metallopeptidase
MQDDNLPQINPADFLNQNQSKKSKAPVKREFALCEEMKEMAEEIIKNERLDVYPAKIEYLNVYPNISKTAISKIVKTGKELKFFANLDYIIEISGEIWDILDKNNKMILLEHQLRHILVLQNDKTGEWVFKVRKHDIQDFGKIVTNYGVDWIKTIKLSLSSMYGLTPAEEDNISI